MITNRFQFAERDGSSDAETRKKSLRSYMKKRRSENENRDVKEKLLIENFYSAIMRLFGETAGASMRRNYFCYLSFSSEAPTDGLVERLLQDGNGVYCPRVQEGKMFAVEYGEDFTLSPLGIREPTGEKFQGRIDVAIAPLLAADKQGNRLGYGGGYYDRFFKEHPQTIRVGYCFDFQIVAEAPAEEWDERLDCIVTDKQVIFTERKAR